MRLKIYSDYMVRVLIHTAMKSPERVTVDEVAETFSVSRHHLVKVVHELGRLGYLSTRRGIGGGFILGKEPSDIGLGDLVRIGEQSEQVIDCKDRNDVACPMVPSCRLKSILDEASAAFFAILDRYTLQDLIEKPEVIRRLLKI